MYFTAQKEAIQAIELGRLINDSKLIKGIIDRDRGSKEKLDMRKGVDYYLGKHDILNKNFQEYYNDGIREIDKDAANNKVPVQFHKLFVKQKISYLLSSMPTVQNLENADMLDNKFYRLLRKLSTNISNKGVEYLHVYINEKGEFDYTITEAESIIEDRDLKDPNKLLSIMRYYYVDSVNEKGELKKITKVEIWTDTQVYYYVETNTGEYVLDLSENPNPRPHWVKKQIIGNVETTLEDQSFGEVPFIRTMNNDEGQSDLQPVKALMDVYDLVISDYANNVQDIQDAIWNVRNYAGTDLKEFRKMLKTFKVISTDDPGGADPKTIEIPVEAKNKLLQILEDNIFRNARAFNTTDENFAGQITGVALSYKMNDLDLKCNELGLELESSIIKFIELYNKYNGTEADLTDVKVIFNKKSIMNEVEQIAKINSSKEDLSLRTRLELNPLVADVEEELKRKSLEDQGFDLNNEFNNII